MKQTDLARQLARMDDRGVWAFYTQTLRLMFDELPPTFFRGLGVAVTGGTLVRLADKLGVFVNPRARSMPSDPLPHLVDMIRPCDRNYLSLESVASQAGLISQMPNRLTVMSTGKSAFFDTPLGGVEFVRTRRTRAGADDGITFDASRGMLVATPQVALRDLRRTCRSLDLIG